MNSLVVMMSGVTAKDVEKRSQRIKAMISEEYVAMRQSFNDKIDEFNRRSKNISDAERNKYASYQESILEDLEKFKCAAQTIIKVYFPILQQDIIIQCLCEEQIQKQLQELKASFDKAWEQAVRRLMRQEDAINNIEDNQESPWENCKTKRIQKVKMEDRIKGKNCVKREMSAKSGLTMKQVNNWFINARERVIKKYVIRQPNKIVKSKKNRREDHSDELDD